MEASTKNFFCGSQDCEISNPANNSLSPFQFNFVGKLLGPKGNSMKRLQEESMTKMAVLGRGSMRNKQQVRNMHATIVERQHNYGYYYA